MSENEKLDLILSEMQGLKQEMSGMQQKIGSMQQDIGGIQQKIGNMQQDIGSMQQEMGGMRQEISGVKQRMTSLELHMENGTDKNIQLLAENFVELTKKLNQAIPVADKNLAYEVKVNYLLERVQVLEEDIKELKSKIA